MSALTPLHLMILVHYYGSATDWYCTTPTHEEYRNQLMRFGLIAVAGPKNMNDFAITEKGRFYIDHLLSTPLPVEKSTFVIPDRFEVSE